MSKLITCGVFITNEKEFLVCHPSGARWQRAWSIPKGIKEENETEEQAAVRETFEETGFFIQQENLEFIGKFPYTNEKDFCLFKFFVEKSPIISLLNCSSFITGTKTPEIDDYRFISIEKYDSYLNPRQAKIFKGVLKC